MVKFQCAPTLEPKDRHIGDIDIVLVVGETAFVIECHSCRHPATPFEFQRVMQSLAGKKEQVMRKRNYLAENPARLVEMACRKHDVPKIAAEPKQFVALVVTNSFLGEGESETDPHLVHIDTLCEALQNGYVEFRDVLDLGREVTFRIDLDAECHSAADLLLRLVKNPPEAEYQSRCLQSSDHEIPCFIDDPVNIVVRHSSISTPALGTRFEILKSCSFGKNIRVL